MQVAGDRTRQVTRVVAFAPSADELVPQVAADPQVFSERLRRRAVPSTCAGCRWCAAGMVLLDRPVADVAVAACPVAADQVVRVLAGVLGDGPLWTVADRVVQADPSVTWQQAIAVTVCVG